MVLQKYCASGNDFLIFHTFKKEGRSAFAIEVCNRHYGFGADGLIALIPHKDFDFEWQFYNSDGSEASMCGNGTRAAALYAYDNKLAGPSQSFLTGAGAITTEVSGVNTVETALTPAEITKEMFSENGFEWLIINTGVPHLVTKCAKGFFDKELAAQMRYKYNANVNFYSMENDILNVRTYERGVEDETLACGTGMAACAYAMTIGVDGKREFLVKPKSNENITIKVDKRKILFKGEVKRVGSCFV